MLLSLRDADIYCEVVGDGLPVLTLHGFSLDHRSMSGCLEPVFSERPGFRRIYFDLPGMGTSVLKHELKNSDHMADAVMEVLDSVVGHEDFLLAGGSYGGYLAREIARRVPERIAGILLICPVILPHPAARSLPDKRVMWIDEAALDGLTEEERSNFLQFAVVANSRIVGRYRSDILPAVKEGDQEFLGRLWATGYSFSHDVDTLSRPIDAPALFLLGRQDHVVGYRDAMKAMENYPRCTLAVLDRAGHNLELEQEELFNCLVNEWLDRVQEDRSRRR
ncbi:MAG: alpha/beta hydrolase [Euryarchaeota archaeon]|nr:alpha/beta hydrolase [Euryarchaeota archaeon]